MEEEFLTKLKTVVGLTPNQLIKRTRKPDYVIGRYLHVVFLHRYCGKRKGESIRTYSLNKATYYNAEKVLKDLSFYPNKYNSLIKQYPKLIA